MKIAILGGGFTGLTAAYYLQKKGHQVTVFEKEKTLGGMAAGFKTNNWDWYLEKTVHHLFANDDDILNFAKEIKFDEIFFREPETASLYSISDSVKKFLSRDQLASPDSIGEPLAPRSSSESEVSLRRSLAQTTDSRKNFLTLLISSSKTHHIFPLDTPMDFLRFPLLGWPDKIRTGLVLAFLKLSPFFSFYERETVKEFLARTMGGNTWKVLWRPLFRKKFGKYAENILASFIWARIKKRTKKLGYVEGGFQTFIDFLEKKIIEMGGVVKKEHQINKIEKNKRKFKLTYSRRPSRIGKETFDLMISTLPTPVLSRVGKDIFLNQYLSSLKKIKYLHSVSLVLETKKPVLEKTYWLNITDKNIPIMGIFQQTNFIEKKHYGGKHIAYIGWYVDEEDRIWKMDKKEILQYIIPHLTQISNIQYPISKQVSNFQFPISNFLLFKTPHAQPIFDRQFLKNKPDFITPVKNFFIANLDMTYPYDRGTNYAVKLGREGSNML